MIQVVDCLLLVLCVELLCPKNRRLEVATSRVERVGLVVTRRVQRHGLLLLVDRRDRQLGRLLLRKVGSSLKRKRSSLRNSNRVRATRRVLLEMVLRYMGVGGSKVTSLLPARGNRSGELYSSLCWLHRRVGQKLRLVWRRS